jgi:putative hemolysin
MSANFEKISVKLAETAEEKQAVERLRYDVFVRELGGDGEGVDHRNRLERDRFDALAKHLIAFDTTKKNDVVGVYRLLNQDAATELGGFYSETEFDLSKLTNGSRKILEVGRSCVHADYRDGVVMYQLWQGVAAYVKAKQIDIMFGVASFHGTDLTSLAHPLSNLAAHHLAPEPLRPRSKQFENMQLIAAEKIDRPRALRETPSLIKAYLRLGGVVGEGAYIDHDFNTVDVCLVMDTATLSPKQRDIYTKERRG